MNLPSFLDENASDYQAKPRELKDFLAGTGISFIVDSLKRVLYYEEGSYGQWIQHDEVASLFRVRREQMRGEYVTDWLQLEPKEVPLENLHIRKANIVHIRVSDTGSNNVTGRTPQEWLSQRDQKIGRWGEEFAVRAITHKFESKYRDSYAQETSVRFSINLHGKVLVEINWLNKNRETNSSPDIIVVENDDETYWEVKSTITGDISNFTFTPPERDFAIEKGDKFWILRVCYAGSSQATVYEIPNPFLIQCPRQQIPDNRYYDGFGQYVDDKGKIRSTASVRLSSNGTGSVFIWKKVGKKNKFKLSQVNLPDSSHYRAFEPLRLAGVADRFNITISLRGGYPSDQIKAIQLGLVYSLIKLEPGLQKNFIEAGFLTEKDK